MRTYSFYVGSTDTHSAHHSNDRAPLLDMLDRVATDYPLPTLTHAVQERLIKNVAIYIVPLATDVQAQRLAFALAALTGNDAILTVRDTDSDDYARTYGSTAPYRVDYTPASNGDRIMRHDTVGADYRYTPAVGGAYVAYLVHLDNTVTPVS